MRYGDCVDVLLASCAFLIDSSMKPNINYILFPLGERPEVHAAFGQSEDS